MRIIIPTRGRVGRVFTAEALAPAFQAITTIVCPSDEVHRHQLYDFCRRGGANVVAQPDHVRTIAEKRAWIMEVWHGVGHQKIVMLDDDLRFATRIDTITTGLRDATHADQIRFFSELEEKISPDVPHAGFGPRQGNNRKEAGWRGPDRMMYVLGYHLPTVMPLLELGRVAFREDMDVTLQLLEKGYQNEVCHTFVVDQRGGYAAKGGCDLERDVAGSDAAALKLADLHPGLVRVVDKEYGTSQHRKEVVCSWAKALDQGTKSRVQSAEVALRGEMG